MELKTGTAANEVKTCHWKICHTSYM